MADKRKIHLIGNAHIDPVWLWRWQEGYAEIKATFRSALDRMEEYPDFIFTCACAAYYQWVEENAPDLFNEIRIRIKEGRWKIVGGMWIQPDCNIPSGESFARHFLYSQSYFYEKFGVRAVTGYNVDSFGHNASLPKLFKSAGINNYVMMRPSPVENPDIPGFIYWWESNDGSRVLTSRLPNNYESKPVSAENIFEERLDVIKLRDTMRVVDETDFDFMHFYGVGNHGGGPTISTIEAYNKIQANENKYHIEKTSPDIYFEDMRKKESSVYPVWKDDLQHHASLCYSACSEIKKNNRRAENRLTVAEVFSVMANRLTGFEMPTARMDKAWQNVLFNQFHDIIAGCSIWEAYEDAREVHGEALNIAAEVINAAIQRISWAIDTSAGLEIKRSKETDWSFWEIDNLGTPIVVFNPLSWKRNIPVQVTRPIKGVTDENASPISVQSIRASRTNRIDPNQDDKWDAMFMAEVPAMGWRVYWAYLGAEKTSETENELKTTENTIENEYLKLEIEPLTGDIKSLYDKNINREVLSENGSVPLVIDVEHADTWGHGLFSFRDVIGRFENAKIQLLESGPVRARLRVTSFYEKSTLRQDFILYKNAKEIEVHVWLDWREKFKLLKLSFPVNVTEPKATYDIPFGNIERPVNGTEETGQMWFDVTGNAEIEKYGLAILNDGKYSFDVLENDMRMTVANGSLYADHYAGNFRDDLAEHLDQGIQTFRYVLLPHVGDWQDSDVVRSALSLNTENMYITETYHEGLLPQYFEGISIADDNVVVSAVKPAMDGNGQILRIFESKGKNVVGNIKLPLSERNIDFNISANSIQTLRIPSDKKMPVELCDLIENVTL